MKRFVAIISFCCTFGTLCAQEGEVLFRGRVTDGVTGESLPLCHLYNLNSKQAFYTDVMGYFSIRVKADDWVQVSFIGYKTQNVKYLPGAAQLEVKMVPDATMLQSAVVRPGENPAHRIIENAIQNRSRNHPESSYSYSCIQYNRMTFHVEADSTARRAPLQTNHPLFHLDTTGYNLIMESVVERTFMAPESLEEKVIASQTSGFKEYQQLSMVPSALQYFHFYDDRIEWKNLNQSYLNPISPNSTSKYFFLLQDTILSDRGDSTFIISYRPSRLSNIDGLKGVLHINSNGWAIENVIAEPATAALFPIRIQQQYRLIDSTTWFPYSFSFEVSYKNLSFTGLNMIYYSISSISDVVINPPLAGRRLAAKTMWIAPDAHKHPQYIEQYRSIPLSQKELNAYEKHERSNYDWAMQIAEGGVDNNSFSFKKLDIPFNQVFHYTNHEGLRLGMGLYTNHRLSPWFSVGGYYRYGFKDQKSKYGASFSFFPGKDWDSQIKLWAQNDLSGLSYSREAGIMGSRWLRNFYIEMQLKRQQLSPFFDYTFRDQLVDYDNGLHNSEFGIQLRYTIREQRAKLFRRTYPLRSDYPVFYARYATSILSQFGYHRMEAGIDFNRFFRNFGRTNLSVRGGRVSEHIPVMMLFNQSYLYQSIFFNEASKSKFNAIVSQIFASNQYINGFLVHDFGTLLGKTKSKIFAPRIAVAMSAGWSRLFDPEEHGETPLYDMQKGYFENGIVVEDIVRANYMNFFYIGLGGALYGAYGGSVNESFTRTLTPMVRLSVSF